jgi:hypothetical protein
MSGRQRTAVAGLLLLGVLAFVVLLAFAGNACPAETEQQPCPEAGRNLGLAIGLAAVGTGLVVAPFAFMAELLTRRRIVYRGAWGRAARRGILTGLVLATLAGLRLAGVLGVPTALFVLVLAAVLEWFFVRNDT